MIAQTRAQRFGDSARRTPVQLVAPSAQGQDASWEGRRLLLVATTHQRERAVVAMIALDAGNQLLLATDVDEAAKRVEQLDGAILGLGFDEGFDLCRRIHDRDARVPVLLLVSRCEARRVRRLAMSPAYFLVAPYDVGMIAAFVEAAARQRIVCATSDLAARHDLSERQEQLVRHRALLPDGKLTELGPSMGISDSSARVHRTWLENRVGALDDVVAKTTGHIGRRVHLQVARGRWEPGVTAWKLRSRS
jgi:hypothetical protein